MAKSSFTAKLAATVGVVAAIAVIAGPAAAHLRLLSPLGGFFFFGFVGLILGGPLSLLLGVVGLFRTRASSGREGRARAWVGTGLGAAIFLLAGVLIAPLGGVPPIHDITTDPDDPPQFVAAAAHPDNQDRDLSYPHGGEGVTAGQRSAYPDLRPIELAVPPPQAFEAATRAVQDLGWSLVAQDPEAGRVEATEESRIFRFVDDVVIRIRPDGDGSVVDLRSTSRVGQSDLGANAERIRAFAEAIRSR